MICIVFCRRSKGWREPKFMSPLGHKHHRPCCSKGGFARQIASDYLYSSPQSPIASNKFLDFVHILSISSTSELSRLKLNTCALLLRCSTIPSLTPIMTPATAGLARIYLVATFAMFTLYFPAIFFKEDKSS